VVQKEEEEDTSGVMCPELQDELLRDSYAGLPRLKYVFFALCHFTPLSLSTVNFAMLNLIRAMVVISRASYSPS
jgi:hypothetical protein